MPNLTGAGLRGGVWAAAARVRRASTPGSGPGHLGLSRARSARLTRSAAGPRVAGYRVRSARAGDVAARGNFCTVDAAGLITDRRAGRIKTEALGPSGRSAQERSGSPASRSPGGAGPGAPLRAGAARQRPSGTAHRDRPSAPRKPPIPVRALEPAAARTAELVNAFVESGPPAPGRRRARQHGPAARFDALPVSCPRFPRCTAWRAAAIAAYPMYRGLAKLVGMDVHQDREPTFADGSPRAARALAGLRLLLRRALQGTPTRPARTAKFDAKVEALERFDAFVRPSGPSARTCSSSPAITPRCPSSPGTAGSRCRCWSGAATAARTRSPCSAERACAAGTLGSAAGASPDAAGHGQRAGSSRSSAPGRT